MTTVAATTTTVSTTVATRQLQRLHGPKPTPLVINKNSSKIFKKNDTNHHLHKHAVGQGGGYKLPVIVYLRSPKVIHVLPHEFMTTVQRLTGKPVSLSSRCNL